MEKQHPFNVLNAVNVNGHTERKNGLTYLSWAWAWAEVKKAFPTANYTIYEDVNCRPYHTDGRTCWVKTGVTIEGLEHIEYLPVMDNRNQSIPLDKVTSMDVNKAIQRSLTKACARHGLGLYIYAGEDLPEKIPTQSELKTYIDNCDNMTDLTDLSKLWGDVIKSDPELSAYGNSKFEKLKKGGAK